MLTAIKTFVRRFRDSDKGSMAAEMALIMPLLAWWFAGSFDSAPTAVRQAA